MNRSSGLNIALGLIVGLAGAGLSSAHAEDFLSALFGAFTGHRAPQIAPPSIPLPFANGADEGQPAAPVIRSGGGSAYCVRTCDGRYFPVPTGSGESRAAACSSLCPASETKVVYGGSIDNAATETGKSYADLPNAFRYRNEIVAGCTCNGKDTFGLASIKIEDDPTLRKGDIVAGPNGLVVANGRADKRAAANFSPVSPTIRAKFARVPVVASE